MRATESALCQTPEQHLPAPVLFADLCCYTIVSLLKKLFFFYFQQGRTDGGKAKITSAISVVTKKENKKLDPLFCCDIIRMRDDRSSPPAKTVPRGADVNRACRAGTSSGFSLTDAEVEVINADETNTADVKNV